MDVAWGSFLLGGLVFGVLAFLVGALLGMQTARAEAADKWWKSVTDDLRLRMRKDETFRAELAISRYLPDDDGGDDDAEPVEPEVEPDRVGTGRWENN